MLSIVIPVLNEGDTLEHHLQLLQPLRQKGCELVGVDGGSNDRSPELLRKYCDISLGSSLGRAQQMNTGASASNGDKLLFLHADTQLPDNADRLIEHALSQSKWGRFDVRLDNSATIYQLIACLMNLRSRCSQIATGDQAMFFRREFFMQLQGFPSIPLMEDVAISKLAKTQSHSVKLKQKVITSARRWEENGPIKTITLMWELRLRYALGQSAQSLWQRYYG